MEKNKELYTNFNVDDGIIIETMETFQAHAYVIMMGNMMDTVRYAIGIKSRLTPYNFAEMLNSFLLNNPDAKSLVMEVLPVPYFLERIINADSGLARKVDSVLEHYKAYKQKEINYKELKEKLGPILDNFVYPLCDDKSCEVCNIIRDVLKDMSSKVTIPEHFITPNNGTIQ